MDVLDRAIGKYKNTYDVKVDRVLTLNDYFGDIKDSNERKVSVYRYAIKKYGKNSDEAKEIKMNIPAVTVSGVFRERKDHDLKTEFTKVIVLDLDAQDNPNIDLDDAVMQMKEIPHTLAVHKSCSGKGLAVYVLIEEWKSNTYNFTRMLYELYTGFSFDNATSNLSRLRYVSNDKDIFINYSAFELAIPKEKVSEPKVYKSKGKTITDNNKVSGLLKWWKSKYSMVSGSRNHNSYVLARSFNSYGVDKSVCIDVLMGYKTEDFNSTEILGIVESAYNNVADFNSLDWK